MTRFLTILTTPMILLFAVFILFIHSQPYDDNDLHTFLTPPDDCAAPCFMGIRPGTTTVEEAIVTLAAHEWVNAPSILEANESQEIYGIRASWSGLQPDVIATYRDLYLWVSDNTINSVDIITHVPLGNIWLALGTPDKQYSYIGDDRYGVPSAGYAVVYSEKSITFATLMPCPIESLWSSEVEMVLFSAFYEEIPNNGVPTQVYSRCRAQMNP
jgi:hypothetical protein